VVGEAAEVEEGLMVVVEAEVEEEEEANRPQQHQPPILPKMAWKEYHPPSSKEIPRCLICSNKNGNCIKPPMSITMT
jgi:hypothetical protein